MQDSRPNLWGKLGPYHDLLGLIHESSEACIAARKDKIFYLNPAAARSLESEVSGMLPQEMPLVELVPRSDVARYIQGQLKRDKRQTRLLQWTPPVLTHGFPGHFDLFKLFAGELAENLNQRLLDSVGQTEQLLEGGNWRRTTDQDSSTSLLAQLQQMQSELEHIASVFSSAPKATREVQPSRMIENLASLLTNSLPQTVEIEFQDQNLEAVVRPLTPRLSSAWFTSTMLCLNAWSLPSGSITFSVEDEGNAVEISARFIPASDAPDQVPYSLFDMERQFAEAGGQMGLSDIKGGYRLSTRFPTCIPEEAPTSMVVRASEDAQVPELDQTILLADDDVHIRTVVRFALTKAGYKVEAFDDGAKALRYYKRNSENLTLSILDLVMPELNGAACLEEIRKLNGEAKVILMSGYRGTPEVSDMIDAGNLYFLRKPFDLSELMTAVDYALNNG